MTFTPTQIADLQRLIDYRVAGGAGRGPLDATSANTLFRVFSQSSGEANVNGNLYDALKNDALTAMLQLLTAAAEIIGTGVPAPAPTPTPASGLTFGPNPAFLQSINMQQVAPGLGAGTKTTWVFEDLVSVGAEIDLGDSTSTSFSFPSLVSVVFGVLANAPSLENFSAPALESCGEFQSSGAGPISELSLPSLVTVGAAFDLTASNYETLSLPSLITVGTTFTCVSNPLVSFSAPNWLPTDGTTIDFNSCALNAVSVNHILARCVAAGVTTCDIDLSDGTSAAPTGQGVADKAALILAGNTVVTN